MKLLVIALALYLGGALLFAGFMAVASVSAGNSPDWRLAAKYAALWPWHLWRMFGG